MRSSLQKIRSILEIQIPQGNQASFESIFRHFTTSLTAESRYPPLPALQQPQETDTYETPKTELVQKLLSTDVMANSEELKLRLKQLQQDFQRFDGDTGSTEVQVALLSAKIQNLSEHMRTHRKDFATRRGLEGMLNRRRKLMQYYRRKDFEAYSVLLVRLGLSDRFAKQDRFMLQHQQSVEHKMKRSHKK